MKVFLTDEMETLIEEKVRSGLYTNPSEVVRDALQRAFGRRGILNLGEDSPELAAVVREGLRSRHTRHRKGGVRAMLEQLRQRRRT